MNLETKITIYKFTPQVFTLTRYYCCKDKRSVFHDIIGWYLKNKGDNLLKNRKLSL